MITVGNLSVHFGSRELFSKIGYFIGPVAVGIDANHKSFLMYKSGIYEEPACSSTDLK